MSRYEQEARTLQQLRTESSERVNPQLASLRGPEQGMPRVLVVDDVALVRQACCELLGRLGLWTMEAADGESALAKYASAGPDVVLLDVGMFGLDGIATLQQLQLLDPEVRVVMLTGMGEEGKVQAALRAGACDYVLKPFSMERVVKAIVRALTR